MGASPNVHVFDGIQQIWRWDSAPPPPCGVSADARPALLVLFGGVVLMLLVAAANVVSLLLLSKKKVRVRGECALTSCFI